MGIGTERSQGDHDQFKTLERLYNSLASTPDGQKDLVAFITALEGKIDGKGQPTTCELLVKVLKTTALGGDKIDAINQNWYGIGGPAQWHAASWFNPVQIQLINRRATAYYLKELVRRAVGGEEVRVQIWGQCQHPDFSIVVRVNDVPREGQNKLVYITVDYYVPYNSGSYGLTPAEVAADPFPRCLEATGGNYEAKPELVRVLAEPRGGIRFTYERGEVGAVDPEATLVGVDGGPLHPELLVQGDRLLQASEDDWVRFRAAQGGQQ